MSSTWNPHQLSANIHTSYFPCGDGVVSGSELFISFCPILSMSRSIYLQNSWPGWRFGSNYYIVIRDPQWDVIFDPLVICRLLVRMELSSRLCTWGQRNMQDFQCYRPFFSPFHGPVVFLKHLPWYLPPITGKSMIPKDYHFFFVLFSTKSWLRIE